MDNFGDIFFKCCMCASAIILVVLVMFIFYDEFMDRYENRKKNK